MSHACIHIISRLGYRSAYFFSLFLSIPCPSHLLLTTFALPSCSLLSRNSDRSGACTYCSCCIPMYLLLDYFLACVRSSSHTVEDRLRFLLMMYVPTTVLTVLITKQKCCARTDACRCLLLYALPVLTACITTLTKQNPKPTKINWQGELRV